MLIVVASHCINILYSTAYIHRCGEYSSQAMGRDNSR